MRQGKRWFLIGFGLIALSACAAQTENVEQPPTGAVTETMQPAEGERGAWTEPGPDVARLRFTLIGVEETVPYVSTVTRVIPIGAAINMVSSAAGGGGTLTGSVTYAIEALDSESGKVVAAAVRRLTPGAFDLSSTMGTKETARAVAKDAAAKLRSRLDTLHAG